MHIVRNFAEDVLVRMMDDRTAETARNLYGHSGPIYSLSFSPDRNLLLSSSEDTTSEFHVIHYILNILFHTYTDIYFKFILKNQKCCNFNTHIRNTSLNIQYNA